MPHPQSHLGCPIRTRSLRMSGVEAAPRDDTLIPSHPRRYQLPFPKRICLYRSSPHLTPNAVISILSEAEGPALCRRSGETPVFAFCCCRCSCPSSFPFPQGICFCRCFSCRRRRSQVSLGFSPDIKPHHNSGFSPWGMLSQPHPKLCHLDRRRAFAPQWRDPCIGFLPLLLPF